MKNKTYDLINFSLAALLLAFVAFAATKASATDKKTIYYDSTTLEQQQSQNQSQAAYGGDGGNALASASSTADGGSVTMQGNEFYALSLMFPQAAGCFTGVQGGAKENSSGFLGFHILNKSCWMGQKASIEQDIEINARLLCADRHYRNALAYDTPATIFSSKKRRSACIEMKVQSGKDQMAHFESQIDDLERKNAVLLKERAYERQYAEDAAARCDSEKERLEENCTK